MIGATVILAVAVLWQWGGGSDGGDGEAAAYRRIKKLANNDAQDALVAEVSAKDVKAACRAVRAMARVGPKAIGGIRVAMKDTRPEVRQVAMIAVSQAGGEAETPVLSTVVMKDKSPAVRAAAALTLGRMRAYREVETLIKALEDDDANVRRRANAAVVEIIGASVSFDALAPPAKRQRDIAALRALWSTMKPRTEYFYESRKKHKQKAGAD
ncbi:MAG: HEAT repeat domain-containing protein [Phycisphaerae bacterium]|jgi:HEAT repeat protein|nr:HEAT repeat domain-containing protein [Phycisphaerae bacterium]